MIVGGLRAIVPAVSFLLSGASAAQTVRLAGTSEGADVIVQGSIEDGASPAPLFRAIWRNVPGGGAGFELQRTSSPVSDAHVFLDRLMEAGIGAYLDARVHFTREGVRSDPSSADMVRDINAMVSAAIGGLGAEVEFMGLSGSTRAQLDRITRIDWGQARSGVDGGSGEDKYLAIYYYVRSQREELERQVRADLLPLSTVALSGGERASPGTTVRINSTCGTVFDEQNFLCALDLRLADTGGGAIDPDLDAPLMRSMAQRVEQGVPAAPAAAPDARVRRRDRWLKQELDAINARIDRMDQRRELWELRDRMEDMEDRMTGLEMDLRELHGNTPPSDNPLANLSSLTGSNITVHFERYGTTLGAGQRVLLNEVFEQLARSPQDKVLITGHTDRSGDPSVNLRLSEQRAKAVRSYLMQRGISGERLLVNYYGDSRSTGRDPGERRVEIEWIR